MSLSEPAVHSAPNAIDAMLSRASAVKLTAPGPSAADLRTILTAATRAPDHGKLQPWRFVIVEGAARDRLGEVMAQTLKARHTDVSDIELTRERDKVFRAPTIVVAVAKIAEGKIAPIEQQYAVAAAVENAILAAHALGYGTMWKTGAPAYDDAVKAFLGFEPRDAIVGFIYLGTTEIAPKAVRETKYDDVVTRL